MNGYIAFFNGKQHELRAASLYDAKLQAVAHFKPSKAKQHMVHVHLAEKDGKEVVHVAS